MLAPVLRSSRTKIIFQLRETFAVFSQSWILYQETAVTAEQITLQCGKPGDIISDSHFSNQAPYLLYNGKIMIRVMIAWSFACSQESLATSFSTEASMK